MTAPVDIAAAVELAKECAGWSDSNEQSAQARVGVLARALIALADERRDIEQRTAEAIAAWLDDVFSDIGDDRFDPTSLLSELRACRWRTP